MSYCKRKTKTTEICFVRSFVPSFLPFLSFPFFLPSFPLLPSFLPSFFFPVRFVISIVRSFLSGKHCRTCKNHLLAGVHSTKKSRYATKNLKLTCASSEDPDEPEHPGSLISFCYPWSLVFNKEHNKCSFSLNWADVQTGH